MKFLLTLCTLCALSWPSMARDLSIELHSPEWLTKAREAIDGKNYDLAINVLTQADEKQSADWHNLMGFSLRLKSPPQLVRSAGKKPAAPGRFGVLRGVAFIEERFARRRNHAEAS
jgi:hypothetical protein